MVFLVFIGCSKEQKYLVTEDSVTKINIKNIDSVRNNLNGFWKAENDEESDEILWLNFDKSYSSIWDKIPFSENFKSAKDIPFATCQPIIHLIQLKDSIEMQLVSMGGVKTMTLQAMSKTTFRVGNVKYRRHKGYSFLQEL